MGFKIVLVGATNSAVAKRFISVAEDLPWKVLLCGDDFAAESEADFERFFSEKKPSVIVSLLPDPGDAPSISQLRNVANTCARLDIPLIHQSCYQAVSSADDRAEVHESVLAKEGQEKNDFERLESISSAVPRHIILRPSWILDAKLDGLLVKLVPELLAENGRNLVVSDHDFGAPVTTTYVGNTVIALVHQILTGANNWGVYHLRSADSCSEAEFCDHLVRQLQKELGRELPFPDVAAHDDERRFMRFNANLVGRKITDDFGVQSPTWRRGFGRHLRRWLTDHDLPNADLESQKT